MVRRSAATFKARMLFKTSPERVHNTCWNTATLDLYGQRLVGLTDPSNSLSFTYRHPSDKAQTVTLGSTKEDRCTRVPWLREASVLVPLCVDHAGQPSILFTRRSATLNSHRGEIRYKVVVEYKCRT